MASTNRNELYQQVILDHNRHPHNLRKMDHPSYSAEGYNPLCGDHLTIYLDVTPDGNIRDVSFLGDGCAISRASASMMTMSLKGKSLDQAKELFSEFHRLITGKLNPDKEKNNLGKLAIFSGIWQYPSRIKCASLSWHAMKAALEKKNSVSTE